MLDEREAWLFSLVLAGHSGALDELMDRYRPLLYHVTAVCAGDLAEPEVLLPRVLERARREVRSLHDDEHLRGYAVRSAIRQVPELGVVTAYRIVPAELEVVRWLSAADRATLAVLALVEAGELAAPDLRVALDLAPDAVEARLAEAGDRYRQAHEILAIATATPACAPLTVLTTDSMELPGPERLGRLAAHVRDCPACTAALGRRAPTEPPLPLIRPAWSAPARIPSADAAARLAEDGQVQTGGRAAGTRVDPPAAPVATTGDARASDGNTGGPPPGDGSAAPAEAAAEAVERNDRAGTIPPPPAAGGSPAARSRTRWPRTRATGAGAGAMGAVGAAAGANGGPTRARRGPKRSNDRAARTTEDRTRGDRAARHSEADRAATRSEGAVVIPAELDGAGVEPKSRWYSPKSGAVQAVWGGLPARHRWLGPRRVALPGRRRLLVALAVVGVLAVVVAIAAASPSRAPRQEAAPVLAPATTDRPVVPPMIGTATGSDAPSPSAPAARPSGQGVGNAGGTKTPGPTRSSPTARPVDAWFEAEAASLYGQAIVVDWGAASGGKIVDKLGTDPSTYRSGTIEFTGVTVPVAGRYHVTVYYVSGIPSSAYAQVNGGAPQAWSFPVGSWSAVYSVTFQLDLPAGTNRVRLGNPTYWAPRLDRIHVFQ